MINTNNYEIYFLDYYENRLNENQVQQLFAFLDLHPNLKDEFNGFENISLSDARQEHFPFKNELKKETINETNIDEFLIASLEGDLNAEEEKQLQEFLQHNNKYLKDASLYEKVKLNNEIISYPHKESLRHFSHGEPVEPSLRPFDKLRVTNGHGEPVEPSQQPFDKLRVTSVGHGEPSTRHGEPVEPLQQPFDKLRVTNGHGEPVEPHNIHHFLIAEAEGDLNDEQQHSLDAFLNQHPEFEKDRKQIALAKLQPVAEVYPHKGELKKTISLFARTEVRYAMAIAAVLFLFVGFYWINNSADKTIMVAQVDTTSKQLPVNQTPEVLKDSAAVSPENLNQQNVNPANPPQKITPQQKNKIRIPRMLPVNKPLFADDKKQQEKNAPEIIDVPQQNNLAQNKTEVLPETSAEVTIAQTPTTYNAGISPDENSEKTVLQTLNSLVDKKISNVTGNELAPQNAISTKNKLLNALAWGVNKIGGKNVKMKNQYTTSNDLMAVDVEAKYFAIEHVSGE